ncbi:unnamed protein product [Brassica oleracea]
MVLIYHPIHHIHPSTPLHNLLKCSSRVSSIPHNLVQWRIHTTWNLGLVVMLGLYRLLPLNLVLISNHNLLIQIGEQTSE